MANKKPWWKSKTILVNLIAPAMLLAETNLHMLQPVLGVNVYAVAAFVVPLVNVYLRSITTDGVSLRSRE